MSDTFSFEEATGTDTKGPATFSFEEASDASKPLPASVKPSAGRDTGVSVESHFPNRAQGPAATLADIKNTRAAVAKQRESLDADPEQASVMDALQGTDTRQSGPMTDQEYGSLYSANARTPAIKPHDSARDTIKPTPGPVVAGDVIRKKLGSSGAAAAVTGVMSGAAGLAKVAPGLIAGVADVADTAGVPGAEAVRDFTLGQARIADQFGDAVQGQGGDYYNKLIGNVFNSVTQNLPTLAFGAGGVTEIVAGKAVANAAAKQAMGNAMKSLFVQTAGQEYADGRNLGFDPAESAARASIFGAAEVIGERFGFHEQMATIKAALGTRKLASHELGRVMATEMMKEIPGEELTTAIEFLADKYGPAAKSPKATLADYFDQAADTAVQTVGQTLLMGAPASLKGTYQRANAAAAYDSAKLNGLNVVPPYMTDTPDVQRKKVVDIFTAIAAQYGIAPDAVKRATEAAGQMPTEQVGPFLKRLTDAYSKRGLVATPVEEHASDTLVAGPIDDPKVVDKMAKEAEQVQADAEKAAEKGAKTATTETKPAATVVPRETTAPEDLTGLSEPSAAKVQQTSIVDEAAHEAAPSPQNGLPEPTQAQKEAGNYQKGHVRIAGLDISVENPEGSTRSGVSDAGKAWSTTMEHHYGYIRGTVGMDKDHVDTFIKPGTPDNFDGHAFVVDQIDPKTGAADEHKVLLGFDSQQEAQKAYEANYEKGWKGMGAITPTSMADFKTWLREGDTTKPFARAAQAPGTESVPAASAPHVIARVGPAPSHAEPLELRPNPDGSATAWHGGHAVLNFESGEPVQIPKGTSDTDALQIVKDSGAFGRRAKYFQPKSDTEVEHAAPAPKSKPSTPGTAVSDAFLERKRAEAAAPTSAPEKINTPTPSVAEAKPEVAPAPPAPPKVRQLSDQQAFARNYAHFEGRDVAQTVRISDTGEEAQLRIPASRAMRELDARLKAITELKGCIGRHA